MKLLFSVYLALMSSVGFSATIENVYLNKNTVEDNFGSCIYKKFQGQMRERIGFSLINTVTTGPDFRFLEVDGDLEIDYKRSRFYMSGTEIPSNTIVRYYLDFETAGGSDWDIEYETPDEFNVIGMRSKLVSSFIIVSKRTGESLESELFRFDAEECKSVLTE